MTTEELVDKATEYALTVLAPKAKAWASKFAIGCGVAAYREDMASIVAAMGCVGEDGQVDLAKLRKALAAGFQTAGKLNVLGGMLAFDGSDVDGLFDYVGK